MSPRKTVASLAHSFAVHVYWQGEQKRLPSEYTSADERIDDTLRVTYVPA
jgi:hypothetical protein